MSKREETDKFLDVASISTRHIVEAEGIKIPDIPESCLDGLLGDLCRDRMGDFPRAWAWPAILAAASVHVANSASIRSNLYVALVGPIGTGKSSAIQIANFLIDVGDSLFTDYVGSAEGLAKHLPNEFGGAYKLWFCDELGHLLDKSRIEGASFVRVLNTAFYHDEQSLIVAKGARHKFSCKLSIIGGIVDEDFEEAFSAITAHGMYDRFIFGYAPTGFKYNYHPLDDYGEPLNGFTRNLTPVEKINPDVWERRRAWLLEHPDQNREFEIAVRCALIAATYDRREEINAKSLGPALAFAETQHKVRQLLRPNMGRNQGGEISQKITDYLERNAPNGEWVRQREMLRATHAARYGMDMVNRTLNALSLCGEIQMAEDKDLAQKPRIVRLIK
jgi:hypothetical protein